MRIRIQVSAADDAKAWGILIRHSVGEAYPNRTFVISEKAADTLREAGVEFVELSREVLQEGRDTQLEKAVELAKSFE